MLGYKIYLTKGLEPTFTNGFCWYLCWYIKKSNRQRSILARAVLDYKIPVPPPTDYEKHL